MDISALTSGSDSGTKSGRSTVGLSDNFDTFLTLLTAQLQNQNPLDPMKADQFTQQLVQYSQVEQSIQTNQNLEALIAAQTAQGFSNMVGYLGKTATMDTNAAGLKDGSANWNYILDAPAEDLKILVKDKSGNVVFTKSMTGDDLKQGEHTFSWDGIASDGREMADGGYSLSISAKAGGNDVDTTILVKGTVESIETVAGQHWLVVKGVDVPLGTLKKVSENTEDMASENPQDA